MLLTELRHRSWHQVRALSALYQHGQLVVSKVLSDVDVSEVFIEFVTMLLLGFFCFSLVFVFMFGGFLTTRDVGS